MTAAVLALATGCQYWTAPRTAFRTRSTALLSAAVEESAAVTYVDPSRYLSDHPDNNVPPHIAALVGKGLHAKPDHPIGIIRAKIQDYFAILPHD